MPARVISGQKGKNSGESKSPIINNPELSQSSNSRHQFYTGSERLDLQGSQVQRVRELQEENDHLQREITSKENEVVNCVDPLVILADIEHRKIVISRNTGEIMKIYQRNEERIQRIEELKSHNSKLQSELMDSQGKFITATEMNDRTDCASKFFLLKSQIEKNLNEIEELNKL